MDHTVLKTKFTGLQESCRRADVGDRPPMLDVGASGLGGVFATLASDVFPIDPLHCDSSACEAQMK